MSSSVEVTPAFKTNQGECQGNQERCQLGKDGRCPLYGTLGREARDGNRRVRGCGDPAAMGKRNRSKGDRKAAQARKALNLVGPNTRHEEHWRGGLLVESKAGAQVGPIWTRYLAARAQAEASRAIGDTRPFVMVAAPDKGPILLVLEVSNAHEVAAAIVEDWGSA